MAVQREQSHHKSGVTGSLQNSGKQSTLTPLVRRNSSARQLRTPNQVRTCVGSADLLPSKFEKVPPRPLPPLESIGSSVQKNDFRASFRPARSSDREHQPPTPVKGQHVITPRTDKSGVQIAHCVAKTAHQRESADDFDSVARARSRGKSPAQSPRSHSVSRLSRLSPVSSSTRISSLSRFPSETSDARPSRSRTPRSIDQSTAVDSGTESTVSGQDDIQIMSARKGSASAVTQNPRQRSSSVNCSARLPLQVTTRSQTSSLLTPRREYKVADNTEDLRLPTGQQEGDSAKEGSPKSSDKNGTANLRNDIEQSPSDRQYVHYSVPTREQQPAASTGSSLEQEVADVSLPGKVKPLEKSSSSHGILGGKSDDEVSVTARTNVDQKSSPTASRHNSAVRINDQWLNYADRGAGSLN